MKEHNIDNGADCWCEPQIIVVGDNRIFVHQKGSWVCTNCGNCEEREREVTCWKCGKGEMVYTKIDDDEQHSKDGGK